MSELSLSLVQMRVTDDKDDNVDRAVELIEQAHQSGPDVVALPENFYFFGTDEQIRKEAETLTGPTMTRLRGLADELGVYIVTGTMKLRDQEGDIKNTCCVVSPDGDVTDIYNKLHVFQAEVGDRSYQSIDSPGSEIVVTDIADVPVGLTVCYDVRFPELYRILALRGAKVVLIPAMFTLHTGKDHWKTLLKARAIENGVFVAAPAVLGQRPPDDDWAYGRSLVADPWGLIVKRASDRETTVTVDLDLSLVDEARNKIPTLPQRRPGVYDWPE